MDTCFQFGDFSCTFIYNIDVSNIARHRNNSLGVHPKAVILLATTAKIFATFNHVLK